MTYQSRMTATLAASALALSASLAAAEEAPITIVINQSPWFPGFQAVVEAYEDETGNTVELDVNPFAGSLEKQRTVVRADESPFDILIMNAGFFVEFYTGGFIAPLQEIDASFELSDDIYTFDDSTCWFHFPDHLPYLAPSRHFNSSRYSQPPQVFLLAHSITSTRLGH